MIVYPALAAALDGVDADGDEMIVSVALASGVPVQTIRDILNGEIEPSQGLKRRIAAALGRNPQSLFRLDKHLERIVAAAPSRKITDSETYRKIDGVA